MRRTLKKGIALGLIAGALVVSTAGTALAGQTGKGPFGNTGQSDTHTSLTDGANNKPGNQDNANKCSDAWWTC